jgi:hypothetical protein
MAGTGQVLAARDEMLAEARAIIDEARARGLVLRLYGGVGVRVHCSEIVFCGRDYSDLDMVGLKAQRRGLVQLFGDFGFEEDWHVEQATLSRQLQFVRPCLHRDGDAGVHPDDHVDVFLDSFKMDHDVDLKDRLAIDDYTISVTDQLLTKLQVYRQAEKDVHDVITLLKDVDVADEEGRMTIGLSSIAARCAEDWGLFHDVQRNLERCAERLGEYALDGPEEARVRDRLARLRDAIEGWPKPLRWRLRARVGERLSWHNPVEEQDALAS